MANRSASALELTRVSKRFGHVVALEDVSIVVRPGTVHALLGENGAGKTTLMHVAYGLVAPDAGDVTVMGRPLALRSPRDAIVAGIGMVHQHFTLVPAMTVGENIALGGRGRLRDREVRSKVAEMTSRTGFALDADVRVETLPVGAQQRVEIAKALARDASLLILDEPTAVLAPAEVEDLLRWLRSFVDHGNAAVLITHKLHEALAVADDVTVLRRGRVVRTGAAAGTTPSELTEAMIGAGASGATDASPPSVPTAAVAPVFVGDHVSIADASGIVRVRDASFSIHGGELVGLAAVEGAGQHELLRALSGRLEAVAGSLSRPAEVGFVPEDRHRDAVLLDRPLVESVALRGAGRRTGVVRWATARACTDSLMQAFDVRAPGSMSTMRTLSGGNQQKLVLARELSAGLDVDAPPAIVVENPTRGLDVRATLEVHRRLREAAENGAAVVFYSSDLDEVLALASRILVLYAGLLREVPLDRAAVGRAMLGTT